jgi:hypothetical protein
MPILGILASSISPSINAGSYFSIATVTVGAGGANPITFSSIPSTYTHLQIRYMGMTSRATYGQDGMNVAFNGVGGTSYARHDIRADGASVSAGYGTSQNTIDLNYATLGTTVSSYPGIGVIDILDYANTNKYKTLRYLGGVDENGTIAGYPGAVVYASGLFQSTNAITSITFTPQLAAFAQYTSFALYGIKG